jgi:hypothetical protein
MKRLGEDSATLESDMSAPITGMIGECKSSPFIITGKNSFLANAINSIRQ